MANEFDASEEVHYLGLYLGTVFDNEDPDQLGRVRVTVPNLLEPFSAWALPAGTLGGGSPQRGFFSIPDKGADVMVMFHQGDVDAPIYWAGHWGKPDVGGNEIPTLPKTATVADAPKVKAFETARFQMVWDDRDAEKKWFILDKITGDTIELSDDDGITLQTQGAATIKAFGDVVVQSVGGDVNVTSSGDVKVNGSQIELNGVTPVGRVGDAVQVTVPPGTFHVTNPIGTPPTVPNPIPVTLPGTITSGSGTVKAG